jgi:methionyl-tRNA formyltransferase
MRIVFMGTPEFAVHSLNALLGSSHEVVAVFTREDKARNRGKKLSPTPVKAAAVMRGIPVHHRADADILREYNPDCIAVAAYGVILREEILALPRYGCLNVHASLLPKYRGAAPINRCIMDGETESGITIMQMDRGLDTGDMLLSEKTVIHPGMTATELHDVLAKIGGRLLVRALDNIETLTPTPQDDSLSTYAKMLTKTECEIDFTKTAAEIYNHIRGLANSPCAYTVIDGKRVKVYRMTVGKTDGIVVECRDRAITLIEIQPEGRKRMSAADYLRGKTDDNR